MIQDASAGLLPGRSLQFYLRIICLAVWCVLVTGDPVWAVTSGGTTPVSNATPAASSGSGNPFCGGAGQRYNPETLFANEKASGAQAICKAEGNCNPVTGEPWRGYNGGYFGHPDPSGNGGWNYGWCSANTVYCPDCRNNIPRSNQFCYQRNRNDGLQAAIVEMTRYGIDPNNTANALLLVSFIDSYNTSGCVALGYKFSPGKTCGYTGKGLIGYLVEDFGSGPYTAQQIYQARAKSCRSVKCVDPRAKVRTEFVHASICGSKVVLGDVTVPNAAADLEITLKESVGNLECWSCGIIIAITRVADGLGNEIFEVLRGSLIALLAAILGIYLVYHAMRVLMPFGPVSSITGIFSQMTLVTGMTLLTITLLGSMAFYWDYIYRPVLSTSVGVTTSILRASGAKLETTCDYPGLPKNLVSVGDQTAAQMSCVARAINKTLSQGTRVGWAMIVAVRELQGREAVDLRKPWRTYPNMVRVVVLILSGVILMGVFIYASLAFLWVIIDIVYRWTFISLISPLAIAAYTFRETRGFSSFAIRGMMESFIGLILTAAVAAVTVKLVEQTGFDSRTTGKVLIPKNIETYIQLLEKADPTVRAPTINTTLFWSLATIGMMAGSLMFKMKELASYLTSSAIGGWATDTGLKITNPGTVLNPINQIVGRFGSERMMRHLERRYEAKFERPYVRPPKMRWI